MILQERIVYNSPKIKYGSGGNVQMSLKENLVNYMKSKKMPIRDLALKTGISEPTLKRLRCADRANPTIDVLLRIAAALDVSVNDLIQEEKKCPVFHQGQAIELAESISEFMILFTQKTFSFQPGCKALFKKYTQGDSITKYVINTEGKIFEKINDAQWLFRDDAYNNYSLNENFIFATIFKELYEVNYV